MQQAGFINKGCDHRVKQSPVFILIQTILEKVPQRKYGYGQSKSIVKQSSV